MGQIDEKWHHLLEAQEQLIQVCEEVDEDLNKNRLVRKDWNEKTSEWMQRFKSEPDEHQHD